MKQASAFAVLSVALLVPALASAQEIGDKGDAVFSADRLMGITGTHVANDLPAPLDENDWTSISFGWRSSPESSPYDVPRLSFDYLVIDHLSIGGSLGYASVDPDDGPGGSAFLLAGRVGYLYSFGKVVGIWPRGGFTYHSLEVDNTFDESGFGLSLECPFTFSPAPHFAFTVGPTFDIDLFGERDPEGLAGDFDRKYRAFGVNAGLLGWF